MATTAIPRRLQRPVGFCPTPGCPNRKGQCEAHRKRSHSLLHTERWKRMSKRRLARFPWCVGYPSGVHGQDRVLAQCTDHIKPVKDFPELAFDEDNHQSMCLDCNRRKGIAEEGGFGR